MDYIGRIRVEPVIPERFSKINEIANNLWWTWNPEILDFFNNIDKQLWEASHANPISFVRDLAWKTLAEKIKDPRYTEQYEKILNAYNSYMNPADTWFSRKHADKKDSLIAYFSAEYGFSEILPIYSGGLGVLSGDCCKSASDLGIPLVAVGLFYRNGYFEQRLNREGWQESIFNTLDITRLPVLPVTGADGADILINVEFAGRTVCAKPWKVSAGRVTVYLLDTDVESNSQADRSITSRLYGGDQETRIQQEILLGIGGIRLLDALGLKPSIYHLNEGHSAFLGLEIARKHIQEDNLGFKAAVEAAKSRTVFTTHTPVPAGNDVFPVWMMEKYFNKYWEYLGLSRQEFMSLGFRPNDYQNFNMTVLALNFADGRNGVSELHGAVTRSLYTDLWPGTLEQEIPITHITNGIHTLTWLARPFREIYDSHFPKGWKEYIYRKETWEHVRNIPDKQLWKAHHSLKESMVAKIRESLYAQRIKNGESDQSIREANRALDPEALTIGFARRFAVYKRANLIFRDIERLRRIIGSSDRPVQIIFAGKAHPADRPAQEVIMSIIEISRQEGFKGHITVIENYDMELARLLTQGVDVWLNNPRRPLEASGTSGQKVCMNGILNLSILDGWWCEGYNRMNGWTIGDHSENTNEYMQDDRDSASLYDIIESEILPAFYERDNEGVPVSWVAMMKESIMSLAYVFNTDRAMQDYTEKMYLPLMQRSSSLAEDHYRGASALASWKGRMAQDWPQVRIINNKSTEEHKEYRIKGDEHITLKMTADLGKINPESVMAEVVYGHTEKNRAEAGKAKEMSLEGITGNGHFQYSVDIDMEDGGEFGYTFRLLPKHILLHDKFDAKLARWAET